MVQYVVTRLRGLTTDRLTNKYCVRSDRTALDADMVQYVVTRLRGLTTDRLTVVDRAALDAVEMLG